MSTKTTAFFRGNKEVSVDFSAEEISSDGSIVLLEKIERQNKFISHFSKVIPDSRQAHRTTHSIDKLLKQRVFMLMAGYEDANDVGHLKNDPLYQDILGGELASQPTVSRFENSLGKADVFKLCYAWLDRYVSTLEGRKHITIDIDATDDPTHGKQQYSMFNGFYGQFMYNELFFHDGETGQIIAPILRPGNSHSNKWYVSILKRIVQRIRAAYPEMKITVRADSGFSCAPFYALAEQYRLLFAVGMASNEVLKRKVAKAEKAVRHLYAKNNIKHQHFIGFTYRAGSWQQEQNCYAKVESTGKGMNIRFFVSNIEQQSGRDIYLNFYVKRGECSENRIKEVKNMCFSDRLSNHGFWANFVRLFLSSLAYEMFLLLKKEIRKTKFESAWQWQIDTIRTRLLKVGATIKKTKRRIFYKLSKAFVHQDLFLSLIATAT
ncbi:IS1380 family transposase [Gelidibacter japonicus]|uniref:IS1380 family transposase n=1 Tax=Gelidibacter japonicus TaxID=1962232 RepID=UPI002AFEBBE1|nr:IS1380 family transposase [Gelidibacter japonicus]